MKDPKFDALLPRLRKRARRLCSSADEAEDLAQETVLRLLQVMSKPQEIAEPAHYAMIMLHNLARQKWRDRLPTEELSDEMATAEPAAPARIACAEARAAIARLPAEQAQVMAQLLAGESSPQAIATRMGVPLGTVMSRLARARVRLRKEMALDGSVSELL